MPPAHGAVNLTHGVTFNGIDPLMAKMEAADPTLDGADDSGCVLDSDLMPIPGLYAVGNNSGGRYIVNYATPISGMSLGLCMVEGCLMGYRLAQGPSL